VLCRAFIALGLRCYAHSLFFFFMGHIFENHGSGLGPALEILSNGRGKLGFETCQTSIEWSDLVWKFIQTIKEKLGFDT
jgi:hypothetical protein